MKLIRSNDTTQPVKVPRVHEAYKGLILEAQFLGDSMSFDSASFKSEQKRSSVFLNCDKSGRLKKSSFYKGTGKVRHFQSNDVSYFLMDEKEELYSGSWRVIKKADSTKTLARWDSYGNIEILKKWKMLSQANIGAFDSLGKCFYILFHHVQWLDTANKDLRKFQAGKSSVVKFDESGKLLRSWNFEGSFTGFQVDGSHFLLWASTGSGDDSIDDREIEVALYDTSESLFSFRQHWQLTGKMLGIYATQESIFISFTYSDTLFFNAKAFGRNAISKKLKTLLFEFNYKGDMLWSKSGTHDDDIYSKMYVFDSHIDFLLRIPDEANGITTWNNHLFRRSWNASAHRLVLDKLGNFIKFYPMPKGDEICFTENINRYFICHYIKDTCSINGISYNADQYPSERVFLFAGVISDTVIKSFSSAPRRKPEAQMMVLYPNPTSSSFRIRGMQSNMLSDITILDLNGNSVSEKHQSLSDAIDVSNLDPGIYFVNVKLFNRKYSATLVKQ